MTFWLVLALGLAVCVMIFRFGVGMLQSRWISEDGDPRGARLYRAVIIGIWSACILLFVSGTSHHSLLAFFGWLIFAACFVLQLRIVAHSRRKARESHSHK